MLLDMAPITIGNNVWIGPNTGIFAVSHPMEAAGRHEMLAIAKPVTIGDGVWIGGNVTVLMGDYDRKECRNWSRNRSNL